MAKDDLSHIDIAEILAELVYVWGIYPDLKQQRDDLLAACESWVRVLECHKGFRGMIVKTKVAIAKCKEKPNV